MILNYFKEKNFGDALNPMIFNEFLPDFFDNDPEYDFFGIGSIIGLDILEKAKNKIIFSSGYGQYGEIPNIDDSYEFICVRGPLTAKALGLDKSYAIADGALLLRHFDFPSYEKKYPFSYMPHWDSEHRFDWKRLCEHAGIHYISPVADKDDILQEILETEILITEAMHGAIVADTLRTPWIPFKGYVNIREFKWQDWAQSVNVPYEPVRFPPLYDNVDTAADIIKLKTSGRFPGFVNRLGAHAVAYNNRHLKFSSLVKKFKAVKETRPYLSADAVLDNRVDALREKLEYVKMRFQRV